MIGIGVTTHNRPGELAKTIAALRQFSPADSIILVVDDASDEPVAVPDGIFLRRLDENVGIARAKNLCLDVLCSSGCDQIFLLDDDTRPKSRGWWKPYVASPEPHLMYIFTSWASGQALNDGVEVYRDSHIWAYSHPRGCMLYLDAKVLDAVGGFDTRYRRWGYEHGDLSNRIYNAGLTSFRFADVVGSSDLIYSGDEQQAVQTTVPRAERSAYLREMEPHYKASFKSKEFCEFREQARTQASGRNVVLTTYTVGTPDPQRGQWTPDTHACDELVSSVAAKTDGIATMVILSDCYQPGTRPDRTVERIDCVMNPLFQRWLSYYQYLRDNPDAGLVWCVDGTDVEMLRDPFPDMDPSKLYVGDESTNLSCQWMIQHHRHAGLAQFIRANGRLPLLNCGILGGTREMVMQFCHDMLRTYFDNLPPTMGPMDMGVFNYVARTYYADKIISGRQVNTVFKAFDRGNTQSWFRHK